MPFERINLRLSNNDWNAAICKTVDVLRTGGIAVVPTDTVYGLAVRLADSRAVKKLLKLKGRNENHPFALAFSCIESINDFCIEMSPLAQRLARRCLPGPVSLVLDMHHESIFWTLPQDIQKAASQQSSVSCRVPDHPLLLTVLSELNEPIILTSANRTGQGETADIAQIVAEMGHDIDLLLDDGPIVSPKPSTIVKIDGNEFTVLREGVLKSETIKRLAAVMILFVCTANTCSSPMAEYLCEKILAERLRCSNQSLDTHGIVVMSAGLSAVTGQPAHHEVMSLFHEWGIDLNAHRSLKLNDMHIQFADYIFAMTRHQRESILSTWRNVDSRLSVLQRDGGDITEPIGHDTVDYQACAEQIRIEINQRINEMDLFGTMGRNTSHLKQRNDF